MYLLYPLENKIGILLIKYEKLHRLFPQQMTFPDPRTPPMEHQRSKQVRIVLYPINWFIPVKYGNLEVHALPNSVLESELVAVLVSGHQLVGIFSRVRRASTSC